MVKRWRGSALLAVVVVTAAVVAAVLLPAHSGQSRPATVSEAAPASGADIPLGLCLVREMDYIPEVDSWRSAEGFPFAHLPAFRGQWRKEWAPRLQPQTVRWARALSGWAVKQMEGYAAVPPLSGATWRPIARHQEHRKVVLEATLDTLPSHSPLVTRWLRAYCLCEEESGAILRVTLTFRGRRLE